MLWAHRDTVTPIRLNAIAQTSKDHIQWAKSFPESIRIGLDATTAAQYWLDAFWGFFFPPRVGPASPTLIHSQQYFTSQGAASVKGWQPCDLWAYYLFRCVYTAYAQIRWLGEYGAHT